MNTSKIFLTLASFLIVFASCEPPVNQYQNNVGYNYQAPTSLGAPDRYTNDAYQDGHHGHDNHEPKSYEFGYTVKDAYSGNDYGRQEVSDGNTVKGEYRVHLPDGRTQIVTYHADWQTGFHADVRYEGEAFYPEPQAYRAQPTNVYGTPQNQQDSYTYNVPAENNFNRYSDFSTPRSTYESSNHY